MVQSPRFLILRGSETFAGGALQWLADVPENA